MIRRTSTQGSRMQGIAYLVLYLVSFSLFVISYARIVLTPPGFARDVRAIILHHVLTPATVRSQDGTAG